MTYLVAAYLVLWVGLFAYLLGLGSRLRKAREELDALSAEPGRGRRP
jgi:CcmD family protein